MKGNLVTNGVKASGMRWSNPAEPHSPMSPTTSDPVSSHTSPRSLPYPTQPTGPGYLTCGNKSELVDGRLSRTGHPSRPISPDGGMLGRPTNIGVPSSPDRRVLPSFPHCGSATRGIQLGGVREISCTSGTLTHDLG